MRIDLNSIQSYIATNSHVLDLACGDGKLLLALKDNKNVTGVGLENDPQHITTCIKNGVNVVEHDLNKGLQHIDRHSYDVVVMTQALQAMQKPDVILEDMLRIGKECIITFPNFAHWKARWHLLVHGRMPVSDLLPYEWYDTPNIHFCTIKDFEILCKERHITVLNKTVVSEKDSFQTLAQLHPNLFGETAVYHLTRHH
ncbi:MAG: methionine biosynthesis protein MetW [Candidatus Endobugula sp.]|jgi:methionine biosynthesis protein MetW